MEQRVSTDTYLFGARGEFRLDPLSQTVSTSNRADGVRFSLQETDFLRLLAKRRGAVVLVGDLCAWLGVKDHQIKVVKYHVVKKLEPIGGPDAVRKHYAGYSVIVPDEWYEASVRFGKITYFPDAWRLVAGKRRPRRECFLSQELNAVLALLADHLDTCVKKEDLYRVVLKFGGTPEPRIVDVLIRNLRRAFDKLTPNGGRHLVTTFGVGVTLSQSKTIAPKYFSGKGTRGPFTKIRQRLHEMRQSQSEGAPA